RFERPTPWFVAKYSIQLSYGRAEGPNYSGVGKRCPRTARGLCQRRIIDVAALAAAIERGLVERVQRRVLAQAAHQVGIGDERLAEGDQVGLAALHRAFGQGAVVAVVGHPGALAAGVAVGGLQRGVVEWRSALLVVA